GRRNVRRGSLGIVSNLLRTGPPGTTKTMLARRLRSNPAPARPGRGARSQQVLDWGTSADAGPAREYGPATPYRRADETPFRFLPDWLHGLRTRACRHTCSA